MQMRSAFLCDLMQHRLVILYWCFGTACCSVFCLDYLTLKDGTNTLSQNVGSKLPIYTAQDPRRVQILLYHLLVACYNIPPINLTHISQSWFQRQQNNLLAYSVPACHCVLDFYQSHRPLSAFCNIVTCFHSLIRTFTINPLSPKISIHFIYKQDHWT